MHSPSKVLRPACRHTIHWVGVWIITLCLACTTAGQTIYYVNQEAVGRDDGRSWVDAFVDLQDALAVAESGDEIWVAKGIYTPDSGTGDRTMPFVVPDGVGLYGGFGGWEEYRDQRDWVLYESILSGDLNGDDGPNDCADFTDCCREHETTGCDNLECQTRVCELEPDCCASYGSYSWDVWCVQLAETDCSDLAGNWRRYENSFVVVEMSDTSSATYLDGFTICGAFITTSERYTFYGGTGVLAHRTAATVRNVRFEDNVMHGAHGWDAQGISFTVCEFHENYFGPIFFQGVVHLADSEVSGNGGAAGVIRGSFTITNCRFSGNVRTLGSLVGASGNLIVRDSTFVGHWLRGLSHTDGHALITDCAFDGNSIGLYLDGSSAVIRNSVFTRNSGRAMSLNGSSVLLSNSILAGNAYEGKAAIYSSEGALRVDNCAFVSNHSQGVAGALFGEYGPSIYVSNSIFWDNTGGVKPYFRDGEEGTFYLDNTFEQGTLDIDYSIVDGWTGLLGGVGNSGADPMFADPLGPDGIAGTQDDNLHLTPGSQAINAGDPDPTGLPATDLDGHARVLCGRVDIGAYEFGIGDFNCDQTIDLSDFANWSTCMTGPSTADTAVPQGCEAFDFNADSTVDLLDFSALQRIFTGR